MELKINNLCFAYSGSPVLRNIEAMAQAGEITAIAGPNGAGKSTLLKCIARLLKVSGGTIKLGEQDLFAMKPRELAKLQAYVPQNSELTFPLTVEEYITLGRRPYISWNLRDTDREIIARNVEYMHLTPLLGKLMTEVSGGERQKALLTRALVQEPTVLLLDEPLAALDLRLRKDMQIELKRIQQRTGITFIYVTHDQEEALTMSDTVVVMNGGKVQQIGTPEDIYNEPKNAFVADFIGDSNIVDGVMHRDFLVSFSGVQFPCVDRGFAREQSVQVVVRPEDIEVVSPVEGQLVGVVNDVIFKGVHFEMHVECEGREWLIHSTRACTPGETIGMRIGPNEIHIMARSEG